MTLAEFIAIDREALLAALEKAAAPDHELHHRIAWHMLPDHQRQLRDGVRQGLHMGLPTPRWLDYDHPAMLAPLFMRSLDAAQGLRLPGYLYNLGHDPDDPARFRARVMAPQWPCPVAQGHSTTDAAALAVAWLRARWMPVMPEAAHA